MSISVSVFSLSLFSYSAFYFIIIIIILDVCLYSDERVGSDIGRIWEEFGEEKPYPEYIVCKTAFSTKTRKRTKG